MLKKNKPHNLAICGLILITLVSICDRVYAYSERHYNYVNTNTKGFKLGPTRLSPNLRLSSGLDTNPTFVSEGSSLEQIIIISPGASLSAKGNRFSVDLGYNFFYQKYLQNSITEKTDQHLRLESEYRSYRWNAKFKNDFSMTDDTVTLDLQNRVPRTDNKAKLEFQYHSPAKDIEVNLGYTNHLRKVSPDSGAIGSLSNLVILTSIVNASSLFRFIPRTAVLTSFYYKNINFLSPPTGTRTVGNGYQFVLGLRGHITAKLEAVLQGGIETLHFDVGPGTLNINAQAKIAYHWRSTDIELGYQRLLRESLFSNYLITDDFGYTIKWRTPRQTISTELAGNFTKVGFSGADAITSTSDTILQQKFRTTYHINKYMDVFTEYSFSQRNSTSPIQLTGQESADFTRHTIQLGILLYY